MAINSRNGNTLLEGGFFAPVRAASTAALTLLALQTVDGVALAEGDRVLVKDQADQTTNGIYAASSGTWMRTTDAASNTDFFSGMAVLVAQGAINPGQIYVCTCTDDPVVVGTSELTFAPQSAVQSAQQTATSASLLAVGTGSKAFATQTGKRFAVGEWLLVIETASIGTTAQNCFYGQVTAYTGGTLTLDVVATSGSGTFNDWTIVLAGSAAAAGLSPPVGTGNMTGPGSAGDGHLAVFDGTTGKLTKDGGKAGAIANLDALAAKYLGASVLAFGAGMINGTIVESHSGGALTVAVKTLAGADPSAADPVQILFRDATASAGDYVMRTVTAALSVMISSGSLLGFSNFNPGRLWLVAFDDAGTVRLGLINCLSVTTSATALYPLAGWGVASSLADDGAGGSDAALQFYTPNGHAVSAKAYANLGYLTWETGLGTAGTWNASPTRIQLFGSGVALPGTPIQPRFLSTTSQVTNASTSTYAKTNAKDSIVLSSAANLVKVFAGGDFRNATVNDGVTFQLFRSTTAIGVSLNSQGALSGGQILIVGMGCLDLPQAAGSTEYSLQIKALFGGTAAFPVAAGYIMLDEIMG